MHDENERRPRNQGDRRKTFHRVVCEVRIQRRIDRQRAGRRQQRIAVRRALGHRFVADIRVRAGPVVDDHLLAHVFGELLRDRARQHVAGTAGRKRHNDADGFGRKTLPVRLQSG
jgi:hypothetical protein